MDLDAMNEMLQRGATEAHNSSESVQRVSQEPGHGAGAKMAEGTQLVCATRWLSGALYRTLLLDVE